MDAEEELTKARGELAKRRTDQAAADAYTTPPAGSEADAAGAAAAADKATATMKEAMDVVLGWQSTMQAGIERLAEAARERGEKPDQFAAALQEHIVAGEKNIARLVEALGSNVTRHELELTLKHGETKKTITVGGKEYQLVEKDAAAAP
jgi:hypothetical protein